MNKVAKRRQGGFTIIELVIVIAILGILSAVAIPRFIDLQSEARQAAVDGVVGAFEAAGAVNFAAKKAGSSSAITTASVTCANLASGAVGTRIMQSAVDSSQFTIANTVASGPEGNTSDCTVTDANDSSITGTAAILIVS